MNHVKLAAPLALLVAMGAAFAGSQSGSDQVSQQAFDKLDRNGDGQITESEAEKAPKLSRSFDELNANGDGALTRNEVGMGGPGEDKQKESGSEY